MRLRTYDKVLDILSIVILLAATVFVIVNWSKMPEQIPSHYNFKGQPDAYGDGDSLIVTVIMGWIILLSVLILGRLPQLWNTGVERTPVNEAAVNRIIRDMLSVTNVSIAVLFAYMMVVPVIGTSMGIWFMPLFLALIFGNIIVAVVRLIRNR